MVKKERMPEKNTKEMIKNGKKELSFFYKNKIKDFFVEHLIERDFNKEECVVDGIKITGKIDKMIVEGNNITVCDYKTGKPFDDWEKGSKEEKIKAWQYKNQLIFYKILVESSRDFYQHNVSSGLLEFVKKNKRNELKDIFLEFKEEDVERLRTLIKIVGEKIKKLDFPDTSKYKKGTKKEILDFEEDLLKNNI